MEDSVCNNYPHEGTKRNRKCSGGPWDGVTLGWYDCQTEAVVRRGTKCLGRYVVLEVQQKNRTIKKVVWDGSYRETWSDRIADLPPVLRFLRLRRSLLSCPSGVMVD